MRISVGINVLIILGKIHVIIVFRSTILEPFQFEPEQKKMCGNESHKEETKHIHAIATDLLHIRVRNEIGANADIVKTK